MQSPDARRFGVPFFLLVLLGALAGCASVAPRPEVAPHLASQHARQCMAWLERVDQAVDAAGVRDAGSYRIPGFAYLRLERLTAALRERAAQGEPAFQAWVARLGNLDTIGRSYELANLPAVAREALRVGVAAPVQEAARCAAVLAREDLAAPLRREALMARAVVPDDYAEWVHATGLYALARIPFGKGVEGWHAEAEEMFRKAASGEAYAGNLVGYAPGARAVPPAEVRAVLAGLRTDALGVPLIGAREAETLFAAYAPYYEIETTGPYDRPGALGWSGQPVPEVDASKPMVYRRLAFTRYGGRVLPQLVYTAWFSERPLDGPFDLLGGKLDGLVFRITLDHDGRPLAYDTIHPCGCYHMFVPTAAVRALPAPDPAEEWALVPATLPLAGAAERVVLRLASRSHHLVNVRSGAIDGTPYAFGDDNSLRALPLPGGGTRSAFGPDGLVAGSERLERAFFWPMGIASPGAMRQWGHHPTAFLGRRHFDDADLIEKRFAPAQ